MDSLGNETVRTVQEYYLLVCAACLPLGDPFPICAVSHFVRHPEPQIRNDVESRWTMHRNNPSRACSAQVNLLLDALREATASETMVNNLRSVINATNRGNGVLHAAAGQGSVSTLASQAERTLTSSQGANGRAPITIPGCTPGFVMGALPMLCR